jgi:hypothetical protein
MFVKDGDGALIDFVWPPMWYWFKAAVAATLGFWVASLLLAIPSLLLWFALLGAMMRGVIH